MNDYQPTSRRPIADIFRKTAHGAVRLCLRWRVHPDVISYFSLVFAALAALCFWQSQTYPVLLFVGPLFCYLRLWCNMLDGMVAMAANKASWRGEVINELPDRFSDVLIFVGVAHSGWNHLASGYVAAIAALLIAYVGTLGQAVGARREFGGVMSKQWRMVVLHLGAWTTFALLWWGSGQIRFAGLTVLDWTYVVIVVGGIQTIIVRLRKIMKQLKQQAGER